MVEEEEEGGREGGRKEGRGREERERERERDEFVTYTLRMSSRKLCMRVTPPVLSTSMDVGTLLTDMWHRTFSTFVIT